MSNLYFLGIGTLMGVASWATRIEVSGSDAGIYPPMSDQLAQAGITASTALIPANQTPPQMKSSLATPFRAAMRRWNTS